MILFGTTEVLQYIDSSYSILNLSSFMERYERVCLLPPESLKPYINSEKDFDLMYANFILNDDFYFMELMKIIMRVYEGKNVLLLIHESLEFVTESLMKFINGRYGLVPLIVTCEEDLEEIKESNFSINGLYNLDIDKNRFSKLYTMCNMTEKGTVEYNGFDS